MSLLLIIKFRFALYFQRHISRYRIVSIRATAYYQFYEIGRGNAMYKVERYEGALLQNSCMIVPFKET